MSGLGNHVIGTDSRRFPFCWNVHEVDGVRAVAFFGKMFDFPIFRIPMGLPIHVICFHNCAGRKRVNFNLGVLFERNRYGLFLKIIFFDARPAACIPIENNSASFGPRFRQ